MSVYNRKLAEDKAREAGLVERKFFGLIKTDKLLPAVVDLIDQNEYLTEYLSSAMEALDKKPDIHRFIGEISKNHFNLEFKRYTNGNPMITIESDSLVSVYEYDPEKSFEENLEYAVVKATEKIEEDMSLTVYR